MTGAQQVSSNPDPSNLSDPGKVLQQLTPGASRFRRSDWRTRLERLEKLEKVIRAHLSEIQQALQEDLGKPPAETLATEIFALYAEISEVRRSLKSWMRPQRQRNPLAFLGTRSEIHWQPRGIALVISPWNYPFQLALGPLISAIAAGNAVCLKPSEFSPATNLVLRRLLGEVFASDEVVVIEGGAEVAASLTRLPFNHIVFTGSPSIGRKVMEAAASRLTSLTLELGGKSPAILTSDARLKQSARRIVWGKYVNAGQTCVAPDYVLVPRELETDLLREMASACREMWPTVGESGTGDYCRIVNRHHFQRLSGLLQDALSQGAEIVLGGKLAADLLWFEPTILRGVPEECRILQEEIFGPILPVVSYRNLEEALDFVNSRPEPLVLYLFSEHEATIEKILVETRSGDALVNDVLVHFANARLPFGGVGNGGQGKLHGRAGFEACSHQRSVMRQGPISPSSWIAPPYTSRVQRLIRWFLKLA